LADPRIPQGPGEIPDDAHLSQEDFLRLHQELAEQRLVDDDGNRRFRTIANLLLASIAGGYVAMRHFPKSLPARLAGEVKDFFTNPKRFGIQPRVLARLERGLAGADELTIQQPWASGNLGDKLGQAFGSARAANDPGMLDAFQTLLEITRQNPKNFPHVASVVKLNANRYRQQLPQGAGKAGLRRLTIGDLFDPTGGWKRKTWGVEMPQQFGEVQNILKELHNQIPGLKDQVNYFNMAVDNGMYIRKRGSGSVFELVDLPGIRWGGNMIKGLQSHAARPGFTGGLASGVLRSLEYLPSGMGIARAGAPEFAILGANDNFARSLLPKGANGRPISSGISKFLYHGGEVRPMYAGTGQIGAPLAKDVILANRRTAVGAMAGARSREMFIRATQTVSRGTQYIQEHGIDPRSAKAAAIKVGDMVGWGPQFAHRQEYEDLVPHGLPQKIGNIFVDPAKTFRQTMQEIFRRPQHHAKVAEGVSDYYLTTRKQIGSDYSNYLLSRVGWLARETLGGAVGMKFGVSPLETGARWAATGAGVMAAWNVAKQVDYYSKQLTGTGPLSAPLQAYAAARNVQQHAMAATGLQQSSSYAEGLFPGLIESPASKLIRGAAVFRGLSGMSPLGFMGSQWGAKAASQINLPGRFGMLGKVLAGVGAFTQLTDATQSPQELAAVLKGEQHVPIRQGRYWALGTQPFTGGRITHTRPHAIPQFLSGAREVGVYGSTHAAQSQTPPGLSLPTPHNWFWARPLLRPYETEQRNYFKRPYPLTGPVPGWSELPVIGPTIGTAASWLVKPTQRWHQSNWRNGTIQDPSPGFGPPGAAEALGYQPFPAGESTVISPLHPIQRLGKQIDILKDFLGMPGFLAGFAKNAITGSPDFIYKGRELAQAGRMYSQERAYYDQEMGGLLGMTELWRRFLPHRRREIEQVNPVVNSSMPDWMPGSMSGFPGDRMSYKDYHRGDPYASITAGESRLPGAGYETAHRLHSGIPGVYDVYDRWKILRDVAPSSQAFRHYDALVRSWARTSSRATDGNGTPLKNILSPLRGIVERAVDGDTVIVNVAGEQMTVRIAGGDAPEIAHRRFEASFPDNLGGQIAKARLDRSLRGKAVQVNLLDIQEAAPGRPKPVGGERLIGHLKTLDGVNVSEQLEEAFPAYDLNAAQLGAVANTRAYMERRFESYPFTERIFDNPLASIPRNMRDLTTRSLSGINTAIKENGQYSLPEKLAGRAWEQVSHIRLPGPLQWPVNKLFAQQSAIERYRATTQGTDFGDWNTFPMYPFKGWAQSAVGMVNPSYVPGSVQKQRAAIEQADAMQFVRMRRFQRQAMSAGRSDLAKFYERESQRTVAGTVISGSGRQARGALPRHERGYFNHFARQYNPQRQQEILDIASPSMGMLLRMTWGKTQTRDADMARAGAMIRSAETHLQNDSAMWHPQYPLGAMKVRVARHQGWDVHDLGLTSTEEHQAEEHFSDVNYVAVRKFMPNFQSASQNRSYRVGHRMQFGYQQSVFEEVHGPPQVRINMGRNRARFNAQYLRHDSLTATGARF
jgi:hypothetical protein